MPTDPPAPWRCLLCGPPNSTPTPPFLTRPVGLPAGLRALHVACCMWPGRCFLLQEEHRCRLFVDFPLCPGRRRCAIRGPASAAVGWHMPGTRHHPPFAGPRSFLAAACRADAREGRDCGAGPGLPFPGSTLRVLANKRPRSPERVACAPSTPLASPPQVRPASLARIAS